MLSANNPPKDINLLKMLYNNDYFIKEENRRFYEDCLALADRLKAKTFAAALKSRFTV